jgi:hypothetical protein
VRRSVERLHLGRGFVVSGKVALDEVAVAQRAVSHRSQFGLHS